MNDLSLVITAGLFSLGGVFLGALLTPVTQLYLERMRERRAADRAKSLVAGELLHAQLMLRSISEMNQKPHVEDIDGMLPTAAWREHRSSLADKVHGELWEQLTIAYARLEVERTLLLVWSRLPPMTPVEKEEAQGRELFSHELGELRRRLGGGSMGWPDETYYQLKPRLARLNDDLKQYLARLSNDELKNDAVLAQLKQRAKELGDLNRELGDGGVWFAEINDEIDRRLK